MSEIPFYSPLGVLAAVTSTGLAAFFLAVYNYEMTPKSDNFEITTDNSFTCRNGDNQISVQFDGNNSLFTIADTFKHFAGSKGRIYTTLSKDEAIALSREYCKENTSEDLLYDKVHGLAFKFE